MPNEYPERSECDFTIYPPKRMYWITEHPEQPELDLGEDVRYTLVMQEKREQEAKQARIREIQLQIADIFLDTEREAKKVISDLNIIDVVEVTRELAKDLIEEYNLLTK